MSHVQQPQPGITPDGRKLGATETVGIALNSVMISVLITCCVFGLQCVFIVMITTQSGDNILLSEIEGMYSQWLLRPLLFSEYLDPAEMWTLFVFGLLNQSGLVFYAVVRPICSVLGTQYRLYGVPDHLRSRVGRNGAIVVLVLLFLNPGAWLDGIQLPFDLGLDWVTLGTSVWALGGAWDAVADYRKLNGQFPNTPPVRPLQIPVARVAAMPQRQVRQYQRSALPPPRR